MSPLNLLLYRHCGIMKPIFVPPSKNPLCPFPTEGQHMQDLPNQYHALSKDVAYRCEIKYFGTLGSGQVLRPRIVSPGRMSMLFKLSQLSICCPTSTSDPRFAEFIHLGEGRGTDLGPHARLNVRVIQAAGMTATSQSHLLPLFAFEGFAPMKAVRWHLIYD